jgi:formate--tetrahydrofolate ligase
MSAKMPTDLDIAAAATLRPLVEVAADLGVSEEHLEPWGRDVAKIDLGVLDRSARQDTSPAQHRPGEQNRAKYVVVTAITPTPLGEGKTTTSVGLAQALASTGSRAVVCLRQPSMGPTFGIKGGAAGAATARSSRWNASTCTSRATSTR